MKRGWKSLVYAGATVGALTALSFVQGIEPAVEPLLAPGLFAGYLASGGFHGTGGWFSLLGTAVAVNLVLYTAVFYGVAGLYWLAQRLRKQG